MSRVRSAGLVGAFVLACGMTCAAQEKKPAAPTPQPASPTSPSLRPSPAKAPQAKPEAKQPEAKQPDAAPSAPSTTPVGKDSRLEVAAEFNGLQATGVAVSKNGRLFACFPRWHDAFKHSLVEVTPGGILKPYPTDMWNSYTENAEEHRGIQFVCVQSIKVDDQDWLWALDCAAPRMEGVKRGEFDGGGPKLVEMDLANNKTRRIIRVAGLVAGPESYLNDFEVDHPNSIIYVTDSGTGCLILVNIRTHESKRVLERHASTKADPNFAPILNGSELRDKKGLVPKVHADGIALDRANGYLYWQALTGKKLFRIKTKVLVDVLPGRDLTGEQKNTIAAAVEEVDETVMTDGMIFDSAGNLYFSAVEKDGVVVRTPDGSMHDLVMGAPISWPDSFAIGPAIGKAAQEGEPMYLYFTNSQIHLTDWFSADGSSPTEPYRILKTRLYSK